MPSPDWPITRLVIGTASPHKLHELRPFLADLPLTLLSLADVGVAPAVDETGDTFAANARKKALELSAWCRLAVVADDSGLEVQALDGAPGVESRRFAGPDATDADRNARLLDLLARVSPQQRGARYVCALALAYAGRVLLEVQGTVQGHIALAPAGAAGFGYDPLFIPEGYDRTIGELGEAVKQCISHRARAGRAFAERLAKMLREKR